MTSYAILSWHSSTMYRALQSFPTRRSSDLQLMVRGRHVRDLEYKFLVEKVTAATASTADSTPFKRVLAALSLYHLARNLDRKSTRLNSSHLGISYAVFCLKKKKKICDLAHL